jgi:hypothetical protein
VVDTSDLDEVAKNKTEFKIGISVPGNKTAKLPSPNPFSHSVKRDLVTLGKCSDGLCGRSALLCTSCYNLSFLPLELFFVPVAEK